MLTSKKVLGILNKKLADVGGGTTPQTAVPMFYLLQGTDVYDVYMENGELKTRLHEGPIDKTLVVIEATKIKSIYAVGDTLNVDDVTTTAYYDDDTHEVVTDWTSNKDSIDMDTEGTKELIITYTENEVTKTATINLSVGAFTPGHRDSVVIPDLYNTGVNNITMDESEKSETFTPCDVDNYSVYDTDNYSFMHYNSSNQKIVFSTYDNPNKYLTDTSVVTFKNIELVNEFYIINSINKSFTLVFENCKVANIQNYINGYDESTTNACKIVLNNCTISGRIEGSNIEVNNCAFYKGGCDAVNPIRDVTINDSYVYWMQAGKSMPASSILHLDGIQTFGGTDSNIKNVTLNNWRIYSPDFRDVTTEGFYTSAGVFLAPERGEIESIDFTDIVINMASGYNPIRDFGRTGISSYNGVRVSNIYGGVFYEDEHPDDIVDCSLNTLIQVSSVFKDDGKINIVASNDTTSSKTLRVVTNLGTSTFTMDKLVTQTDLLTDPLYEDTTIDDLPIDKLFQLDDTEVEFVVCYDGDTQIRFVDFTDDHHWTKYPTPDTTVIPDKYNTGAHGTLTPITIDTSTADEHGLKWRQADYTTLSLDFNNGVFCRYMTEEQKDVVFEDVDFVQNYMYLDFLNRGSYKPESTYRKDFQITFTFKNCRFGIVNLRESNKTDTLAPTFRFENCTFLRIRGDVYEAYNCKIGDHEELFTTYEGLQSAWDSHSMNGDPVAGSENITWKDCYIVDAEDNWYERGSSGVAHIDGIQFAGVSGVYNNVNIENLRIECPSMPWDYTQGGYNVGMFLQGKLTNSTIKDVKLNGGGYYGLAGQDSDTLDLINIEFGNNYGANRTSYPYGGDNFPMTGPTNVRTLDLSWQEHPIVSSIFYDGDDTKVVYSNDTDESKTLTIKTSDGDTYTQTVEAMPMGEPLIDKDNTIKFSDYPIDRVYTITGKKPEWVQVYDGTTLIRTAVLA